MAAATDLLSLSDALAAVRLSASNTAHAARLEGYVTAVSAAIDELVGPVVRRTITGERLEGGRPEIRLRHRPVYSISSVKVWQRGVSTTLTAETLSTEGGYLAEPHPDDPTLLSGELERRGSWYTTCWEYGTIEVTYSAGRFADTDAVKGTRFHTAAVLALKHLWQGEVDTVGVVNEFEQPVSAFPVSALPRAVASMLNDQIQHGWLA